MGTLAGCAISHGMHYAEEVPVGIGIEVVLLLLLYEESQLKGTTQLHLDTTGLDSDVPDRDE